MHSASPGSVRWRDARAARLRWFLGQNQLQLPLYDATTGGCRDGLHADRVNENQGAESTLSFLLALARDARAAARPTRQLSSSAEADGYEELFRSRAYRNPILTAADWPYPVHTVFNPGATRLPDGTTPPPLQGRGSPRPLAPLRGALEQRRRRLGDRPEAHARCPSPTIYPEELWGIEDPRITFVDELGKYAIAYTAFSKERPGVSRSR